MKCPDCKTITMEIDFLDINKPRDAFEVVYKCLKCKATFFGTFYRDLNQEIGDVNCEECEGGKDDTTRDER